MSADNRQKDKSKLIAETLNLCTVSVSQIIDYNDVYVLEQEYETILNNLNLENIPKDEPFLDILTQLLNVISYFRIQEKDKKIVEKQYQKRLKEALWSAIPSVSVISASGGQGGLIGTAISLVVNVGIGYMNYRKECCNINDEYDRQKWELEKAAMEQFDALRREMFATAWKISKEHNFSDKYRLTAKQIEKYNRILMDPNDVRRYERLDEIKCNFEAYPPFWYYFANAALSAASQFSEESDKEEWLVKAEGHYKKLFELTDNSDLLRTNTITAAGHLEYAGICLTKYQNAGSVDSKLRETILEQLAKAQDKSNHAPDVLQMCLVFYSDLGYSEKVEAILKSLVINGYNTDINACCLSSFYADRITAGVDKKAEWERKYDILKKCIADHDCGNLYLTGEDFEKQKDVAVELQQSIIDQLIDKYWVKFNQALPPIETISTKLTCKLNDEQFLTEKHKEDRKQYVAGILEKKRDLKQEYYERIAHSSWEKGVDKILFDIATCFEKLCDYSMASMRNSVKSKGKDFSSEKLTKDDVANWYNTMQDSFSETINNYKKEIKTHQKEKIEGFQTPFELSREYSMLLELCEEHHVDFHTEEKKAKKTDFYFLDNKTEYTDFFQTEKLANIVNRFNDKAKIWNLNMKACSIFGNSVFERYLKFTSIVSLTNSASAIMMHKKVWDSKDALLYVSANFSGTLTNFVFFIDKLSIYVDTFNSLTIEYDNIEITKSKDGSKYVICKKAQPKETKTIPCKVWDAINECIIEGIKETMSEQ